LTIKLSLPFILLHNPAKAHQNQPKTSLNYSGNSLKIVILNCHLTPLTFTCDLD